MDTPPRYIPCSLMTNAVVKGLRSMRWIVSRMEV